ncbi:energy transducer TonB [Polaribacter batillariae]|uniref:energy transducer TonB n=1 Tax=Polaribacter batillariae TaxID=2808900 RepID=UPI001FB126AE|nr:energy transducer TonB [Polaribacter batillariae]
MQVLDTFVNFSSIDTYPSFKVCDSLIEKAQQEDCFRNTIHNKIGEELLKHEFTIKDSIFETVIVNLLINSKGNIELETIESSEIIKKELPELDSILKVSIRQIPIIYPAIKRGIPVTTKYRLPIQIQLKE